MFLNNVKSISVFRCHFILSHSYSTSVCNQSYYLFYFKLIFAKIEFLICQ